jgi:hypothetical protein
VDEASGKIVSTLSLSDLRGVVAPMLPSLVGNCWLIQNVSERTGLTTCFLLQVGISVRNFLMQRFQGRGATEEGLPKPLTCNPGDSLRYTVNAMLARQVHRIFVVDDAEMPVDVISFTDIIACVYRAERNQDVNAGEVSMDESCPEETKKRPNGEDIGGTAPHRKVG